MNSSTRKKEVVLFNLSAKGLAWFVLPFPSCGFVICVILSLIYNFEESTSTHCRVANYLPSISSAIGGSTPQRYIWRICIALHSAPRLMLAICYYNYYNSFYVKYYKGLFNILAAINSLLHILENLCLVLLTYVSSNENFDVHKLGFVGFMVFSQLYMILSLILFKWSHNFLGMDSNEKKSFRLKRNIAVFNISVFIFALYIYWRHNTYCEPGMYSIYAIAQYMIVMSNIMYHYTFTDSLKDAFLSFQSIHPEKRNFQNMQHHFKTD